jgi:hypothetical protein
MFGFGRKQPLELVPFADGRPRTFNTLLCDGLTAYHLASFAEWLDLHARLQAERPDCHVLASLDDLGQAAYTSGHATDSFDLDATTGHDLSGLDPAIFEDGEHPGHLSTPAEFPIRLANLLKQAVDVGEIEGLLYWGTPGDENDLVTINRDPGHALAIAKEQAVIFQYVPAASAADALAAFPNGYFSSDLNPMQCHALAAHLEARYGFALIGIGSRFLAFRRAEPLPLETADRLAGELTALYAATPPGAAAALASLLGGRAWLLFRYTES